MDYPLPAFNKLDATPHTPGGGHGGGGGGSSSPWTRWLTPSLFTAGGQMTGGAGFSTSGLRSTSEPSTPNATDRWDKDRERNLFEESFGTNAASPRPGTPGAGASRLSQSVQLADQEPSDSQGAAVVDAVTSNKNMQTETGSNRNRRPRLGQLDGAGPAAAEHLAAAAAALHGTSGGRTPSFSSEQSSSRNSSTADTLFSSANHSAQPRHRLHQSSASVEGASPVSSVPASPKTSTMYQDLESSMDAATGGNGLGGNKRGAPPSGMTVDLSGISLTLSMQEQQQALQQRQGRRHSNDSPLPLFRDAILHPTTGSTVDPIYAYQHQQHNPTTPAIRSVTASAVASAAHGEADEQQQQQQQQQRFQQQQPNSYQPFTSLPNTTSYSAVPIKAEVQEADFDDDEEEYDQLDGGSSNFGGGNGEDANDDDFQRGGSSSRGGRGKKRGASAAATKTAAQPPKKRGRKVQPVEDDEGEDGSVDGGDDAGGGGGKGTGKLSALERNRIAASKSRKRKREKVANLEQTCTELTSQNAALNRTVQALYSEVQLLRMQLTATHPDSTSCKCQHVQAYLEREQQGGGIVAIERIAGDVLLSNKRGGGEMAAGGKAQGKKAGTAVQANAGAVENGAGAPIPLKKSRA